MMGLLVAALCAACGGSSWTSNFPPEEGDGGANEAGNAADAAPVDAASADATGPTKQCDYGTGGAACTHFVDGGERWVCFAGGL